MYTPSSCKLFQEVNMHSVSIRHELSDVVPSASGHLQLVLCLLWLTTLQLYHLPPLLPPLVNNSSCLFTQRQPPNASNYTIELVKVLYCKIKNVSFFWHLFLCIICIKGIINLLQYYMANCSWVPGLILLDLWTNWTYRRALGTELVCM